MVDGTLRAKEWKSKVRMSKVYYASRGRNEVGLCFDNAGFAGGAFHGIARVDYYL